MPHVKTSPYRRVIGNIQLGGYALYGIRIVSTTIFNLFLFSKDFEEELVLNSTKCVFNRHPVCFDFRFLRVILIIHQREQKYGFVMI